MVTSVVPQSQTAAQRSSETVLSSYRVLLLAVVLALLVRTALMIWGYRHGVTLDEEGTEYVRLAENLRFGHGYVGILNNGTQLNFSPLFPLLIAALSFFLPTAELSARVLNILLGSALVVPMFKLADQIYSRKVAQIVAMFIALHPLLVARSTMGCSETPYLTLIMTGVYLVARWFKARAVGTAILPGLVFGLAYLIRPEAMIFVGVFAAAILAGQLVSRSSRSMLIPALSLVITFALVASPYVAFLSFKSGKFRVEGKGAISYALGIRAKAGMRPVEAGDKIGDDLSPQGVYMKPYYEVLNETSPTLGDLVVYVLDAVPGNVKEICKTLATSQPQGAPVLFVLVVVGFIGSVRDRRQRFYQGILLLSALSVVLALLSVREFYPRFFHPFMGLLLLWASKGAEQLYDWSCNWFPFVFRKPGLSQISGLVLPYAAVFLVLAVSFRAVRKQPEFKQPMLTERKISGQWLARESPGSKSIMSSSSIPAYYAGGSLMYLPYTSSAVALRYIYKKKPDFIVLLELRKRSLPYLAQWFDRGIPDQSAKLIYDQSDGQERVKIYRWAGEPRTPTLSLSTEQGAN
jgi:hypothetical protein